ncbi:hypothetical protein AB4Y45_13785 [Paraburkholderia sp. EG287A]|uniref:hypothetical protein n=1 Tax=unclassified Paraburkholderia TaxID=2615204 RepID=UPI0034D20267
MEMFWMTNHVASMLQAAVAYSASRSEPAIRRETFASHPRLAAHIRPSIKRLRGAIGRHFARLAALKKTCALAGEESEQPRPDFRCTHIDSSRGQKISPAFKSRLSS